MSWPSSRPTNHASSSRAKGGSRKRRTKCPSLGDDCTDAALAGSVPPGVYERPFLELPTEEESVSRFPDHYDG